MASLDEMGGWREILTTLMAGHDLEPAQARAAMEAILAGEATGAQIAGFIVALRMKGEAVPEVVGMVEAMFDAAAPIELPADLDPVDIVGTGGAPTRRVHALNVSTAASLVAAGAGAKVLKHGNRKASSTSGSFDLLDELGVAVELDGPGVVRCLSEAGVGFCFARYFHPAMRHAAPVRAELGVPTVFNFLGPLANPARVRRQVIGVSDLRMAPTVIGVLQARQFRRAMVVHGHDGMDELTLTGPSTVFELRDGAVTEYELDPRDHGLDVVDAAAIAGGGPADNARIVRAVLAGERSPHRDIILLNAAAGLVVAGVVDDFSAGVEAAAAAVDSGAAARTLAKVIEVSTAAAADAAN